MKVMIVTPYFYPKIGGLENYAYNIAKGLHKKYGWDVVIVTSNHESKTNKIEEIDGLKIYRLASSFFASNTPVNFKWKKLIMNIIEKEKPNVVNGHLPVPFIADMAQRASKEKKVPFFLTYHNDLVKENLLLNLICKAYYLLLGNKTLKLSDKIIATSDYYVSKSYYLGKYKNKILIVSPGVNISKVKVKQIPRSILFVSQLDKTHTHKGLNYLIEAMSKIKDTKLIVVGKGDNMGHYKSLAKSLGVNATFTGGITDKELVEYYSRTTMTILPSYNEAEGFGMVLIEARAHKKPVIGTNVGGIPFVIDHGKNGLLVPPKNSQALEKAINKILDNPKLAKELGENGYKKVKTNFTWDIQTKKMNSLLKEF